MASEYFFPDCSRALEIRSTESKFFAAMISFSSPSLFTKAFPEAPRLRLLTVRYARFMSLSRPSRRELRVLLKSSYLPSARFTAVTVPKSPAACLAIIAGGYGASLGFLLL